MTSPLTPLPEHPMPQTGPRELQYENPQQKISRVKVEFPGFTKEIYVSDTGSRAGMVYFHEGKVLLVRQYRYLTGDYSWEIPGGKIEDDEEPSIGAAREAEEETGLSCASLHPLLYYLPGLDCSDNPTHVFLCTDFGESTGSQGVIDPEEISGGQWVCLDQALRMVFERQIVDAMTIIGLLGLQSARAAGLHGLK